MFTDTSRLKDLYQLKAWMSDPKHSPARRKMFFETYKKIQSQLHDRKLATLRERLTKATIAEDKYEMWKITNQIKDYMGEELIGQKYE
jgi:hypothetical protein